MMNSLRETNDLLLSPKIANDNLINKYTALIKNVGKNMFGLFSKRTNSSISRKKRSVDDSSADQRMDYASV